MIATQLARHLLLILANYLPRYHCVDRVRVLVLRLAGLQIGRGTRIAGPLVLDLSLRENALQRVKIGARVYINFNCRISAGKSRVLIGNDCLIGPNVSLETATHKVDVATRSREWTSKPIILCDNSWIGASVVILAGVTVGENAIVAAGAVVASDVGANTMVGGVPAKGLKTLS